MGELIHARVRVREDGQRRFVYRCWHTSTDAYTTSEMTDVEMWRYLRRRYMERAIKDFDLDIEDRLMRARAYGSSELGLSTARDRDLTGPWEKQREEWGEDNPESDGAPDPDDIEGLFVFVSDHGGRHIGEPEAIYGRIEESMGEQCARKFVAWADLAAIGEVLRFGINNAGHRTFENEPDGGTLVRYEAMVVHVLPHETVFRPNVEGEFELEDD